MSRVRYPFRPLAAIMAAMAALQVAGCAELMRGPPHPASTVARRPPAHRPAVARPGGPAEAPGATEPAGAAPADSTVAQPGAPDAVASLVAPIELVGRSRADVVRLLGEPSTRKELASGQSWTYEADGCSLEVLFFLDLSRNDFYALQQHMAGGDGTPAGTQRCVEQIRHAHRG